MARLISGSTGGGGGSGDVIGPASATDNAIARYDGTSGKVLQSSLVTVDDLGEVAAVSLSTNGQKALQAKPYGPGAGQTGVVSFHELSANGNEYVGFRAPDAVGTTVIWTLPPSDGAAGQVLATSGAGVLSWAAAGLTRFTEAESTAAPNATVYVDSLTATASTANADAAIVPKGLGALLGQVPDGTATGGNKRGTGATDWQRLRSAATRVASGGDSTIGGGYDNLADAIGATIGGGYTNAVSTARSYGAISGGQSNTIFTAGTHGFIGGGQSNVVQAAHAVVAGGFTNAASGQYSAIGGGANNQASNTYATVAGGGNAIAAQRNIASGVLSFVGGGAINTASAQSATIGGGETNTASGTQSTVGGGSTNSAAGNYSTIGGGQGHSIAASRTHAVIAGGQTNTISTNGTHQVISGGSSNTTNSAYAVIAGGQANTVGSYSVVGGGSSNQACNGGGNSGTVGGGELNIVGSSHGTIAGGRENTCPSGTDHSAIPGGYRAQTRYLGEIAHASGQFANKGDAQSSTVVLRRLVTTGTTTELTLDGAAPTTSNTIVLSDSSMLMFQARVSARDSFTANEFAWWHIVGGIGRNAGATTTVLVGTNTTQTGNTGLNSAGWTCTITADATAGNGRLQITVSNPASGGSVRFVASVSLTRVA